MKNYTEEEKEKIGKELAEILQLRKDKDCKGRYSLIWGNKTNTGIFETIRRLGQDIEAGNIINSGK